VPVELGESALVVSEFLSNIPTIDLVLMDLYASRYTLLYASFISVGVSVISVLLLRYLASVLVLIVIGGTAIVSLSATGLLWYAYAISGIFYNECILTE
jgi:hypothetical protein